MRADEENTEGFFSARRFFFFISVVLIPVLGALAFMVIVGLKRGYIKSMEKTFPVIQAVEVPGGIPAGKISLRFDLRDEDSGLDEAVVRIRQRGHEREVLRQSFNCQKNAPVNLDFDGAKSGFEEGTLYLEVRVFDCSFWNNGAQEDFTLAVDYRRPHIEVLTGQHNARLGGSQLLFYRASDDNLLASGVKVGKQTFYGFPAKGLDPQFEDPNVFVVIYALDLRQPVRDEALKAFAEDRAGNQSAVPFYNKIAPRAIRPVQLKLSNSFLEGAVARLARDSYAQLAERARNSGFELKFENEPGTVEYLVERFDLVNKLLRQRSEEELREALKNSRYENYATTPFNMPPGAIQSIYGDLQKYVYDGREIGEAFQSGYEIIPGGGAGEISAAGAGVVHAVGDFGTYGTLVAIDHGLGLISLYGHLQQALVRKGEIVAQGRIIGIGGESGFSRNESLYFGMRVQGVPVDPIEWTDGGWHDAHIRGKVSDMKRALGIAVYRPLE